MRAAIYCRVSTDQQEREGTSLQTQMDACQDYCKSKGYNVAYQFSETFSGLSLERPRLDELRDLIRNRYIDVAVIYCLDRLSRDPTHGVIIIEEIEKHHVILEAVSESVDSSELGKLISYIRGFASKLEVAKIRERTMRGRMQKVKEGKQPGGKALYGYRLVDCKHEIYDDEAKIVRLIFKWLAEDALTIHACQICLVKQGIPSPMGKRIWRNSTVYRLATDGAYMGDWCFAKTYKKDKHHISRPKDEWVHISIPAIITKETFEKAQNTIAKNRAFAMRNTRREYLLGGLLVCGRCGKRYYGRDSRGKTVYCCKSRKQGVLSEPCDAASLKADRIEPLIWDTVAGLLNQPQLLTDQMKKDEHKSLEYLEANLDRINHTIAKKTVEADRMLEAYKIGVIDMKTLKEKVDKIRSEEAKLNEEKARIEAELLKAKAMNVDEARLREFCQSLPCILNGLDFNNRRSILREVVDKIEVNDGIANIYGIIPPPKNDVAISSQSS
jgi:site-specific DNA recombinase